MNIHMADGVKAVRGFFLGPLDGNVPQPTYSRPHLHGATTAADMRLSDNLSDRSRHGPSESHYWDGYVLGSDGATWLGNRETSCFILDVFNSTILACPTNTKGCLLLLSDIRHTSKL